MIFWGILCFSAGDWSALFLRHSRRAWYSSKHRGSLPGLSWNMSLCVIMDLFPHVIRCAFDSDSGKVQLSIVLRCTTGGLLYVHVSLQYCLCLIYLFLSVCFSWLHLFVFYIAELDLFVSSCTRCIPDTWEITFWVLGYASLEAVKIRNSGAVVSEPIADLEVCMR